jgi:hypothetical protein
MTEALMKARVDFDRAELGPVVLDFYASSLERGLAARERLDPRRVIDVVYRDFVDDNLRVAERIYGHFGLPLPPPAQAALRAHAEAHPQGAHGRHEYHLERYGLSPERVRERFRAYTERFDLPSD